jgi:hypothetical protein
MPRCEEVVGEEDMSAIENLTEARSDKSVPFRITVRFRAQTARWYLSLWICRWRRMKPAAAEPHELRLPDAIRPGDCGASFWSWATPEGWR